MRVSNRIIPPSERGSAALRTDRAPTPEEMLLSCLLTASRWGQDKRGHNRSAAISHSQLSGGTCGQNVERYSKMWQDVVNYGNMCALKATCGRTWGNRGPSVKRASVPTPPGSRRLCARFECSRPPLSATISMSNRSMSDPINQARLLLGIDFSSQRIQSSQGPDLGSTSPD